MNAHPCSACVSGIPPTNRSRSKLARTRRPIGLSGWNISGRITKAYGLKTALTKIIAIILVSAHYSQTALVALVLPLRILLPPRIFLVQLHTHPPGKPDRVLAELVTELLDQLGAERDLSGTLGIDDDP